MTTHTHTLEICTHTHTRCLHSHTPRAHHTRTLDICMHPHHTHITPHIPEIHTHTPRAHNTTHTRHLHTHHAHVTPHTRHVHTPSTIVAHITNTIHIRSLRTHTHTHTLRTYQTPHQYFKNHLGHLIKKNKKNCYEIKISVHRIVSSFILFRNIDLHLGPKKLYAVVQWNDNFHIIHLICWSYIYFII